MLQNFIFFLGGNDGEMQEIKDILQQQNLHFYDNNLDWDSASTTEYEYELHNLKREQTAVLVELTINDELPTNIIIIDHHNNDENKKSSLEQIADLLGIELNRWQKLIAANDKGYIPAMECLCATKDEINEIRALDRKAQGVTEEDEKLAEESIKENKTEENGIIVIKAKTEKFSPIADRMYGKANRLLICTNEQLVFYGTGKNQITGKYALLVNEKKAYYGGGENGFFGLAKGNFTEKEINSIRDEIISMKTEEKIFSHHIFLFPFKWRKWNVKDETSLKDKFDVKFFREEVIKNSNWNRLQLNLNRYDHYNEYNYFYDYVKEVLYDLDSELNKADSDENLINHFEYKLKEGQTYNIKICGVANIYSLDIDSILLNVYKTGTAVLSFHLRNHLYGNEADILKINKFGRRIFVPFFDLEPDSIYTGKPDETKKEKVLCGTKKSEVPDAIWIGNINLGKDDKNLFEDFEKYREKENFKHGSFLLPKFIEELFPEKFLFEQEMKGYCDLEKRIKNDYKINICPVLDDRMHVVCWYGNTDLVKELNQVNRNEDHTNNNSNHKNNYSYELSDWWYSYIFVDTSPMHTDRFIKQKLLKEHTYTRWVESGTLFGISRFSFVMLTSSFSDLEKFNATFLVRHLQTMYYKMAELCLLQRATVLSFSDEVTHVSNLIDSEEKDDLEKGIKKIEELYKHYILFVNKIYFREVTAQEQGIEIYDMMQRIMRLQSDVKDLDSEIDELNRFAKIIGEKNEVKEMKEQTKEAHQLTKLATWFLPATLIAGLLGMNVLPTDFDEIPELLISPNPVWPFWISIMLITLITWIGHFLLKKYFLREKNTDNKYSNKS